MYVVKFDTESGDHYVAVFKEFPTDKHLSAYVLEHYPDEIRYKEEDVEESNPISRTIFWEVHDLEPQELPKPLKKAIRSI